MATIKDLYRCIDACNGEIRLMAVRYGSGWYCLVAVIEVDDLVWDKFTGLSCGDNEYFEARKFFGALCDGDYILAEGETPEMAMQKATEKAAALLEGYDD